MRLESILFMLVLGFTEATFSQTEAFPRNWDELYGPNGTMLGVPNIHDAERVRSYYATLSPEQRERFGTLAVREQVIAVNLPEGQRDFYVFRMDPQDRAIARQLPPELSNSFIQLAEQGRTEDIRRGPLSVAAMRAHSALPPNQRAEALPALQRVIAPAAPTQLPARARETAAPPAPDRQEGLRRLLQYSDGSRNPRSFAASYVRIQDTRSGEFRIVRIDSPEQFEQFLSQNRDVLNGHHELTAVRRAPRFDRLPTLPGAEPAELDLRARSAHAEIYRELWGDLNRQGNALLANGTFEDRHLWAGNWVQGENGLRIRLEPSDERALFQNLPAGSPGLGGLDRDVLADFKRGTKAPATGRERLKREIQAMVRALTTEFTDFGRIGIIRLKDARGTERIFVARNAREFEALQKMIEELGPNEKVDFFFGTADELKGYKPLLDKTQLIGGSSLPEVSRMAMLDRKDLAQDLRSRLDNFSMTRVELGPGETLKLTAPYHDSTLVGKIPPKLPSNGIWARLRSVFSGSVKRGLQGLGPIIILGGALMTQDDDVVARPSASELEL